VNANTAARGFSLVSRTDCHLCEVMHEELLALFGESARTIPVLDVDADRELLRRYGHKVPVLLLDGEPVCSGSLDRVEIERLMRGRP
jgi:ABC-type uncharacterized transport system ATPase subunit